MLDKIFSGKEISIDLVNSQGVIIMARWILVTSGLLLALWNPMQMDDLRVQIVLILGLAVGNFFLHAQMVSGKAINPAIVYAASAADMVVITGLIISQGGFDSTLFVFYFPAILAMSVTFHPSITAIFAGTAITAYALISLATLGNVDEVALITRLIMMTAVAVCGGLYWHIEQQRRQGDGDVQSEPDFTAATAGDTD